MIRIRKSSERGHFDYGWLNTYHTFSFGDYDDPDFRGFGTLRVLNEDKVAPGEGFPEHAHRDMEIITCILSGALEHRDSMGNNSVIRPGEIQRMSAGTGIRHSEYNPSGNEPVHLLQIWMLPERKGLSPGYEQKFFPLGEKTNVLRLVASPGGQNGSVTIRQRAFVYDGLLEKERELDYKPRPDSKVWLQMIRGNLRIGEENIEPGDGAAISGEKRLGLRAIQDSEFLLFDMAA